jgi:hypothetical protein
MPEEKVSHEVYEIRLIPLVIFVGIFMGLGVFGALGIVRLIQWWIQ